MMHHSCVFSLKATRPEISVKRWGVARRLLVLLLCSSAFASGEDAPAEETTETPAPVEAIPLPELEERARALAERQDELSMRLQDLSWKWADNKIVVFLEEIDYALLDARDLLEQGDVSGDAIAAENDAIEKIYQAAKKNQQQQSESGSGKPNPLGAMMDQLDYMTGKKKAGKKPGKGKGEGEGPGGDSPGQGGGDGTGTTGSVPNSEASGESAEERVVPKGGGVTPAMIPAEFRSGMEALRDELELPENQ